MFGKRFALVCRGLVKLFLLLWVELVGLDWLGWFGLAGWAELVGLGWLGCELV